MLVKLEEYVNLNQGLAINAQSNHLISNKKTKEFSLPLLKIVDMTNGCFSTFVSNDVNSNVIASEDDIIYTRTGQIGLAFRGFYGVVHNNSFIVSLKTKDVDKNYLFVILRSDFVKKQALTMAKNSVQPDLTHSMFKSIKIPLYDIEIQRKIAKTILSIESQIERNNAMVKKLQVLSQAIFKRWFIQFEYPSSTNNLVYNEELKKDIPFDWQVVKLRDLIRKIGVVSNTKGNIPTIDLSVMPPSNISLVELNSSNNFNTNLNEMYEGNILLGSIRPYLKKCGIAPCNGCVAGTVHQFEELKENAFNYALITMSQDFFFDYALKVSKGTRMPVVSADDILDYKVPYNEQIVKMYNKIPIRQIIVESNKSTQKLIMLKEKLLPLLINGQLE